MAAVLGTLTGKEYGYVKYLEQSFDNYNNLDHRCIFYSQRLKT